MIRDYVHIDYLLREAHTELLEPPIQDDREG